MTLLPLAGLPETVASDGPPSSAGRSLSLLPDVDAKFLDPDEAFIQLDDQDDWLESFGAARLGIA